MNRPTLVALALAVASSFATDVTLAQQPVDSQRVVRAALAGFRTQLEASVPHLSARTVLLIPRPFSTSDYVRSIPEPGPDSVYRPLAEAIGGRVAQGAEVSRCQSPASPTNCTTPLYSNGTVVIRVGDPILRGDSARVGVLVTVYPDGSVPTKLASSANAWWVTLKRDGGDWKFTGVAVQVMRGRG